MRSPLVFPLHGTGRGYALTNRRIQTHDFAVMITETHASRGSAPHEELTAMHNTSDTAALESRMLICRISRSTRIEELLAPDDHFPSLPACTLSCADSRGSLARLTQA